jgi:hypothetical protein
VAALREPAFGSRHIAAGLVKAAIDDLLVARHLLAEPVVDGAVRRLTTRRAPEWWVSARYISAGACQVRLLPQPPLQTNIRSPTKPADTISAV